MADFPGACIGPWTGAGGAARARAGKISIAAKEIDSSVFIKHLDEERDRNGRDPSFLLVHYTPIIFVPREAKAIQEPLQIGRFRRLPRGIEASCWTRQFDPSSAISR